MNEEFPFTEEEQVESVKAVMEKKTMQAIKLAKKAVAGAIVVVGGVYTVIRKRRKF